MVQTMDSKLGSTKNMKWQEQWIGCIHLIILRSNDIVLYVISKI